MKARLPFLFYFIFFNSSNTTSEHSASDAGGINDYFMRSANAKAGASTTATSAALCQQSNFPTCPKTLPYAAPRCKPETILQDESEDGEDAGETGEDGLPKPIQVGNILFKCEVPTHNAEYSFADNAAGKRRYKRYLAYTNSLAYHPEVYTEADRTSAAKLPTANN